MDDVNIDEEYIADRIADGEGRINHEYGDSDDELKLLGISGETRRSPESKAIRHWTVERSADWLNKLTTDEQDAICELTSNGFTNMQRAIGQADESLSFFEFDRAPEDHLATVSEAIDKAPSVEPFVCYRGTSVEEISELLGTDFDGKEMPEITPGQEVGEDSRIRQIPESTSVQVDNAKSFGMHCFLELKMETSASPVNVSAWGPAETEFLTNPNSNYEIDGLRKVPIEDDEYDKDSFNYVLSLREKRNK